MASAAVQVSVTDTATDEPDGAGDAATTAAAADSEPGHKEVLPVVSAEVRSLGTEQLVMCGKWTAQQSSPQLATWIPGIRSHQQAVSPGRDAPNFVELATGANHTLLRTADGYVYATGTNTYGQLGQGDTATAFRVEPISLFQRLLVRQIACGGAHSVVLSQTGHVYAFGCGAYGRLGHGNDNDMLKPRRVRVYDAGNEGNTELKVKFSHIACGDRHTVALASEVEGAPDTRGRVYCWGDGGAGRLGTGGSEDRWYPTLIQHWLGGSAGRHAARVASGAAGTRAKHMYPVDITGISGGMAHSAATTAQGEVYTWGDGGDGRLGHGSDAVEWTPRHVLSMENVAHVACGARHTLLTTWAGHTFGFGRNDTGQLGIGNAESTLAPKRIVALDQVTVQTLHAGATLSAVVDNMGTVYTWGLLNDHSRDRQPILQPKRLPSSWAAAAVALGPSCVLLSLKLRPFSDVETPQFVPAVLGASHGLASRTADKGSIEQHAHAAGSHTAGQPPDSPRGTTEGTVATPPPFPGSAAEGRGGPGATSGAASGGGGGGGGAGGAGFNSSAFNIVGDVTSAHDPQVTGMFSHFLEVLQQQHAASMSAQGASVQPVVAEALVENILKLNAIAAGILDSKAGDRRSASPSTPRSPTSPRKSRGGTSKRSHSRHSMPSRASSAAADSGLAKPSLFAAYRRPAHGSSSSSGASGQAATGLTADTTTVSETAQPLPPARDHDGGSVISIHEDNLDVLFASPPVPQQETYQPPSTAQQLLNYPDMETLDLDGAMPWTPTMPGAVVIEGGKTAVAAMDAATPADTAASGAQDGERDGAAAASGALGGKHVDSQEAEAMRAEAEARLTRALTEQKRVRVAGFSFGASPRKPLTRVDKDIPGPGQYNPYQPIGASALTGAKYRRWAAAGGSMRSIRALLIQSAASRQGHEVPVDDKHAVGYATPLSAMSHQQQREHHHHQQQQQRAMASPRSHAIDNSSAYEQVQRRGSARHLSPPRRQRLSAFEEAAASSPRAPGPEHSDRVTASSSRSSRHRAGGLGGAASTDSDSDGDGPGHNSGSDDAAEGADGAWRALRAKHQRKGSGARSKQQRRPLTAGQRSAWQQRPQSASRRPVSRASAPPGATTHRSWLGGGSGRYLTVAAPSADSPRRPTSARRRGLQARDSPRTRQRQRLREAASTRSYTAHDTAMGGRYTQQLDTNVWRSPSPERLLHLIMRPPTSWGESNRSMAPGADGLMPPEDSRPGPTGMRPSSTPGPGEYRPATEFKAAREQAYIRGYSFGADSREHSVAARHRAAALHKRHLKESHNAELQRRRSWKSSRNGTAAAVSAAFAEDVSLLSATAGGKASGGQAEAATSSTPRTAPASPATRVARPRSALRRRRSGRKHTQAEGGAAAPQRPASARHRQVPSVTFVDQ